MFLSSSRAFQRSFGNAHSRAWLAAGRLAPDRRKQEDEDQRERDLAYHDLPGADRNRAAWMGRQYTADHPGPGAPPRREAAGGGPARPG